MRNPNTFLYNLLVSVHRSCGVYHATLPALPPRSAIPQRCTPALTFTVAPGWS